MNGLNDNQQCSCHRHPHREHTIVVCWETRPGFELRQPQDVEFGRSQGVELEQLQGVELGQLQGVEWEKGGAELEQLRRRLKNATSCLLW